MSRGTLAVVLAGGAAATGGLAALAETVAASPTLSIGRISGSNRYATAVDIARATFAGSSGVTPDLPSVIMATGTNFPDALAASYLAGEMDTSILLTDPESLPAATRAGLVAFHTRAVDLIGGPAAVGDSVVSSLNAMGISVKRIFDQDGCTTLCSRFDTMESVDTLAGTTPGTSTGPNSMAGLLPVAGQRTAILATGNNFPDALAAGPLAVADHFPIILTAGDSPEMSPQALAVIRADKISHLIVVGGAAAINPAQYSGLVGITVDTSATEGANRSQTSELLALDEVAHYGMSDSALNIADGYDPSFNGLTGVTPSQRLGATIDLGAVSLGSNSGAAGTTATQLGSAQDSTSLLGSIDLSSGNTEAPSLAGFTPDALAGAVLGGTGSPIAPTLITDSPTNPGFVVNFVRAEASTLVQGDVFGGTSAVSPGAMSQVLAVVPGAADSSAAALGQRSAPAPGGSEEQVSDQPGSAAAVAVQAALAQQGVPYVYGGSSPYGFDCSGLIMYAWAAAGVSLPHNSVSQYYDTTEVPLADLAPGDLVFYDAAGEADPGHVAMYIGGGQVVVADTTGTVVRVESMYNDGTPVGFGQVP